MGNTAMLSEERQTTRWVAGIVLTMALGLGGWALAQSGTHAERITRVEVNQSAGGRETERMSTRLDRIDGKLDRLLEMARR